MQQRRIGSITLGLTCIVFGVLFFLSIFIERLDIWAILRFWPIILIVLGLEFLITGLTQKDGGKIDGTSVFLIILVLLFAAGMALVRYLMNIIPQWIS